MIVIRMLQDSLASIPLLKYAVERSKRKGSQLHRHIERMFDIALLLLNTTLETLERRSARVYAWFSNVLSVTPSGMYMPQDSAVVILGDIDGMPRASPVWLHVTQCTHNAGGSRPRSRGCPELFRAWLHCFYVIYGAFRVTLSQRDREVFRGVICKIRLPPCIWRTSR